MSGRDFRGYDYLQPNIYYLDCDGTEQSILDCPHYGGRGCRASYYDASVICQRKY